MAADSLLLVRLAAPLAELLGLTRSLLSEPHGGQDEQRELQVLRLPVFEHLAAEIRRRHVAAIRDARRLVCRLLVVVSPPARGRLSGQSEQEDGQESE